MGLFGSKKKELIPEVYAPHQPAPSSSRSMRPGGSNSNSYPQDQPQSQYHSNSNGRGGGGAPSIASSNGPAPSYRTAPSYVGPSQGGGGYGGTSHYSQPQQQQPGRQQGGYANPQQQGGYGDTKGGGGGYGRNGGNRAELFSGAPPQRPQASSSRSYNNGSPSEDRYGGNGGQEQAVDEEEEEVEGIKQQLRFTKQESLASTRNALRIAQEAEETSRATLDKLGDQSDRIANTERHLDLAKAHNERAVDETKELEALNRSIFRPSFTFNKDKKRDKEELRILNRHNAEKASREETRRDQYESRTRIESTFHGMDRSAENAAGAKNRARARGADRGRYQFEATGSDDEVEDEIDDNLNEMAGVVGRLRMLAMTAGEEVDSQNGKLGKLGGKVDDLDNNVIKSTNRLGRVK